MNKREKKETLFEKFAGNLALYCKESAGRFACPICLKLFDKSALDLLDLAHIVPEKLGGRRTTLTCKRCNNYVGHEIEAHEVKRARNELAMSKPSQKPITARVRFRNAGQESGSVGVEMIGNLTSPVPELHLKAIDKITNPEERKKLDQMFEQAVKNHSEGWGFTLEWNSVNWKRARITYLHIAHLCLFHQFGYEWACDPSSKIIREQIMRPGEELFEVRLARLGEDEQHLQELSVHVICKPRERLSFMVAIPPMEHIPSWTGIFIPFFGQRYTPQKEHRCRLELVSIPHLHDELAKPSAYFLGRRLLKDYWQGEEHSTEA